MAQPLLAQLWGVLPQAGHKAVPGYASPWQLHRRKSCWQTQDQPKRGCLSCIWLPFPSVSSPGHPDSAWSHLGQARRPCCRGPRPFQLGSHGALLKGSCLHSLILWFKGSSWQGKGCPHFFLHHSEVEAGNALPGWLTSFGLKPLILTRFEAAGWQLVHVVGVVPRAGLREGPQDR